MKSIDSSIGAILGACLLLASTATHADEGNINEVTYAKDIAPILYDRCVSCHRPGQIGPMSFMNYEETRPWVKTIKKSVMARTMPPWGADPAYGKFANDCSLSEEQIASVARWVDSGAPSGDLAQAPKPPIFEDGAWQIGKPDHIFSMPKPYVVPDELEDHYETFVFPTNLDKDTALKAIELRAGDPAVVHHILVFILPEGVDPAQAFTKATFLTGWAPGTNPIRFHDPFGKTLPVRSSIMFQLHYHKEPGPGTGTTDQSSMAIQVAEAVAPHQTTTAWVWNPTIAIPPHEANFEAAALFNFTDEGWILGFVPHMHLRGKDFTYEAQYPDGTSEILLSVPKYDFNWQTAYALAEPKLVPRGTTIRAVAHWDNSAANPNNPDPNQTVYFSEATTDEMMIGFMEYAYKNHPERQAKFGRPEKNAGRKFGNGGFGDSEMTEKLRERKKAMTIDSPADAAKAQP